MPLPWQHINLWAQVTGERFVTLRMRYFKDGGWGVSMLTEKGGALYLGYDDLLVRVRTGAGMERVPLPENLKPEDFPKVPPPDWDFEVQPSSREAEEAK